MLHTRAYINSWTCIAVWSIHCSLHFRTWRAVYFTVNLSPDYKKKNISSYLLRVYSIPNPWDGWKYPAMGWPSPLLFTCIQSPAQDSPVCVVSWLADRAGSRTNQRAAWFDQWSEPANGRPVGRGSAPPPPPHYSANHGRRQNLFTHTRRVLLVYAVQYVRYGMYCIICTYILVQVHSKSSALRCLRNIIIYAVGA